MNGTASRRIKPQALRQGVETFFLKSPQQETLEKATKAPAKGLGWAGKEWVARSASCPLTGHCPATGVPKSLRWVTAVWHVPL